MANPSSPGTETQYLQLIDALYASATDPAKWDMFLDRITQSFAGPATLYRWPRHAPDDNIPIFDNFRDWPDHYQAYHEYYRHRNVWVIDAAGLPGAIHPSEQIVRADLLERTEFYADWLRPLGLKHGVSCRLIDRNDMAYNLGIIRSPSRGAFEGRDQHLLSAIIPHMQRALELAHMLEELQERVDAGTSAFEAMGAGVLLLDMHGTILFANCTAERLLATTPMLLVRNRRLGAVRSGLDDALRGAITAATGLGRHVSGRTGNVLAVPRGTLPPLAISITPLDESQRGPFGRGPLALAVMNDPLRKSAVDAEGLRALYGLTRSEARLAASLAAGQSLAAYAQAAGVSMPTVKTHLAAVFGKTGVNRQAELIRLLATNPSLALGRG